MNNNGTSWLNLVRESVIVQGIITIMCIAAVLYLAVTNQTIPPFLADITSLIIGFYFGAKVQNLVHKAKG